MSLYMLKILLPEKKVYEAEISALTVLCENGLLTVLANHEPMIATIGEGPLVIKTAQETLEGTAGAGLLKVSRDDVVVMVHSFKWGGEETEEEALVEEENEDDLLL